MPLTGALSVTDIMHPSLLAKLDASFFRAAVAIQENTPTNSGGVLTDSWANVSGLAALDAAIAPAGAAEVRTSTPYRTYDKETHTVLIAGYYTAITPEYRAVVTTPGSESLTLNILGVEHDSANELTRLRCEAVTG